MGGWGLVRTQGRAGSFHGRGWGSKPGARTTILQACHGPSHLAFTSPGVPEQALTHRQPSEGTARR